MQLRVAADANKGQTKGLVEALRRLAWQERRYLRVALLVNVESKQISTSIGQRKFREKLCVSITLSSRAANSVSTALNHQLVSEHLGIAALAFHSAFAEPINFIFPCPPRLWTAIL
jgi:Trp operon repressor